MIKIPSYLNPISQLGKTQYSFFFSFFVNLLLCILSEFYAYEIAKNPLIVGSYIIFINVVLIIYFAFRDGLLGGFAASTISILYYFYIIFTRQYSGSQLDASIRTTILLAVIYFFLAAIIGWLKQRIDILIEQEANEKKRLETIIQQLPVGILITDHIGKVVQRNKQLDTILGVKIPIGFVIGKDTLSHEKINGKPIKPSQAPLLQALKTGSSIVGKEFLYERKDGTVLSLQVNSAPIHNKSQKIIAAASIISDITQQKDLEKQKDEFLGIASHELKTPVTSIKAYGQVLQAMFEKKGDTKAVIQLQKMDNQINKLTSLIADLLDVTKIRSGRLEFHKDYFDFNDLVKEIINDLQVTTTQHSLITKLSKPITLYADRDRIGQVITNLITNAIKYSPEAQKVIITTEVDKQLIVCVEDFGIGIPKEKQKNVFDQFFRVGGTRHNTFPGLGLGLYISAEIIKREGGKIWVKSEEGKGARFYFKLPIKKPRNKV